MFLGLGCHDKELCSWVDDFQFSNDRSGIGGDEELAQMVHDELVPTCRYAHTE